MYNAIVEPMTDATTNDPLPDLPSAHSYKERKIVLTPIQHVDGTWVCYYIIVESGPRPEIIQQHFPSRNAAVSAALQTAKSLIDSR
ncbi:MAG: hypothetical protein QM706_01105 [Nitrospira sp.]